MSATALSDNAPGRAGVIAMLVCGMFPMLGLFAIGISLPQLANAFASHPDAVLMAQLIGGASGFSFAIMSPIIGILIERFGYRNVYVIALIGFAILGSLPALMNSLPLILATRLLFGIAVAGTITAGMTGLGKLPPEVRPHMFGRNALMSSVGAFFTFPLVGMLATISWRAPFLLHLAGLLFVPLALTLPRNTPASIVSSHGGPKGRVRLGIPAIIIALAGFVGLTMYVGPMFSPFYLRTIGVVDPRLAAVPLSCMSIASLVTTFNYARLHRRFGTNMLFGIILGLIGVGLTGAGLSPNLPTFAASMATVSCGLAMFTPNLGSYISAKSSTASRDLGWAMGAMFSVQLLFPLIAHAIADKTGSAGVFFMFGGLALSFALSFTMYGFRRRHRPES